MILFLRRGDDPPEELIADDDRVLDISCAEELDIDELVDVIFEADVVVVW